MSEAILRDLQHVHSRLQAGEPLRLLVGQHTFDASEIVLTAAYQKRLRADLLADIVKRIDELSPPEDPATPAAAMPIPQAEGAG